MKTFIIRILISTCVFFLATILATVITVDYPTADALCDTATFIIPSLMLFLYTADDKFIDQFSKKDDGN